MSGETRLGTTWNEKKIHEGWILHQTLDSQTWTRYWIVLQGNVLYIFKSDRTSRDNMMGCLSLSPGTQVHPLATTEGRKDFGFQLLTISTSGEKKINHLKFKNDNDRDLWKAFIIGVSQGTVPSDVNLLHGQLRNVHEAIQESRPLPPPRNTSRQSITSQTSPPIQSTWQSISSQPITPSDSQSDTDSMSIKPLSTTVPMTSANELPRLSGFSTGMPATEGSRGTTLEQLMSRQSELALKTLETDISDLQMVPTCTNWSHGSFEPPNLLSYRHHSEAAHDRRAGNQTPRGRPTPESRRLLEERLAAIDMRDKHRIDNMNNNLHPFYLEPSKNINIPSWFVNCTREEAELILTAARNSGNTLLRPSSRPGSYVISMKRDVPGGFQLHHYSVIRDADGDFKIDVENKHGAMQCLSQVMEQFLDIVGPTAKPWQRTSVTPDDDLPEFDAPTPSVT